MPIFKQSKSSQNSKKQPQTIFSKNPNQAKPQQPTENPISFESFDDIKKETEAIDFSQQEDTFADKVAKKVEQTIHTGISQIQNRQEIKTIKIQTKQAAKKELHSTTNMDDRLQAPVSQNNNKEKKTTKTTTRQHLSEQFRAGRKKFAAKTKAKQSSRRIGIVRKNITQEISEDYTDIITDFIPYACYYNDQTIITKNGELLQTIKLNSFVDDAIFEQKNIREEIRNAIINNIPDQSFAFWIHTVKTKTDLDIQTPQPQNNVEFNRIVHDAWREINDFDNQFQNELYITILIEGKKISISNPKNIFSHFSKSILERDVFSSLESKLLQLTEVTDKITSNLKYFNANKLSIYKHKGSYYSQHLQFFDQIINFTNYPCELPLCDLSQFLSIGKIAYSKNTVSLQNKYTERKIAIFSIKEYLAVSQAKIDELYNLPIEIVTYQTFDFTNAHKTVASYEEQIGYLNIGLDQNLIQHLNIAEIDEHLDNNKYFGQHQISIIITGKNQDELTQNVSLFCDKIEDIGLIAVREDIAMEDCFYATLPGNFSFLRRLRPMFIKEIAGLVDFANYPTGLPYSAKWGPALTIFKTNYKTPYFLNFHDTHGHRGHITITGPLGCGKTALSNFLISESMKYNPNIFILSTDNTCDILTSVFGGTHATIKIGTSSHFNPYSLLTPQIADKYNNNLEITNFLKTFTIMLCESANRINLTNDEKDEISNIIKTIQNKKLETCSLSTIINLATQKNVRNGLIQWSSTGRFAGIISDTTDHFNTFYDNNPFLSLNLGPILNTKIPLILALTYIMFRINLKCSDSKKTILKIDEAWGMFDNKILGSAKLSAWLKQLDSKNATAILTLSTNLGHIQGHITNAVLSYSNTQIYYKDNPNYPIYKDVFNLSSKELHLIETLEPYHIMLKHGSTSLVTKFNFIRSPIELGVLSGSQKAREIATLAIKRTKTSDFSVWSLPFYEEYEKFISKEIS